MSKKKGLWQNEIAERLPVLRIGFQVTNPKIINEP